MKRLHVILYVFTLCLIASGSTLGKAYITLISDIDERGQSCEIFRVSEEANVTGVAIVCKEEVFNRNGSSSSKQISLVWPADENDSQIKKTLVQELYRHINSEANDIVVIGAFEENPRGFTARYAHIAIFQRYKIISGAKCQGEISASELIESLRK